MATPPEQGGFMGEELRRVYQAILQAMADGDIAAVATIVAQIIAVLRGGE